MAGSDDKMEGVREEFLAEAQELVEQLSRDLLILDQAQKDGHADPDALNDLFRGVHTLKGLAGMFGFQTLSQLAHHLEDLLEELRLGRMDVTQDTLDLLFEGTDGFQRLLAAAEHGVEASDVDVERFARLLHNQERSVRPPAAVEEIASVALDPTLLSVLTEYEEHRLRTVLQEGRTLYRLRICLPLEAIDRELDELKRRARHIAEIITYLPSMGGGDEEQIDIEILLATSHEEEELRRVLQLPEGELEHVERRPLPDTPGGDAASSEQAETGSKQPDDGGVSASVGGEEGEEKKASIRSAPPAEVAPREQGAGAPAVAEREAQEPLSLRSVANTVRVDIRKLDHLMNVVGELGIVRSAVGNITERLRSHNEMRELTRELHRVHRTFERHLNEVQDGILDVRMVPLSQIFDKLARVVRSTAREKHKDVRLRVSGAETEVDKLIAEDLADPLMHIIRNAVDHGVEGPEEREAAGKQSAGALAINAFQQGNHVVIEVEDDGKGIDADRLVEKAIEKNLLGQQAAREISQEDVYKLIFMPGFSTAKEITELSGRGVGMDVVKTNINRMGGIVDVHSQYGVGTKFTITLPITLAIINALIVRVRDHTFAIPLSTVREAFRFDPGTVRRVDSREVLTLRGATLPICRLADQFRLAGGEAQSANHQFVVVVTLGHRKLGFVVDELLGQQDVVIKPLGASLRAVRGIAGATDLGDQRLVLVLDAPGLLEEALSSPETGFVLGATA